MRQRIYGLETEYAISYERADRSLAADADRALIGALFDQIEIKLRQQYRTVETDTMNRAPTHEEDPIHIREGHFVESGARVYYDMGHIEWSTPETSTPGSAVLYDLAGQRTLIELARQVDLGDGGRIMLTKNNVDYVHHVTYGCHENYLVPRFPANRDRAFFDSLVKGLIPFLVTRQIFCGAGRIGGLNGASGGFQLSQRADFMVNEISEDTRKERGIVNSRDETLGDKQLHRRLHLIIGDSNMSQYASILKLGATAIVLHLIEDQGLTNVPVLADPLLAIKQISQDLTCQLPLDLAGAGSMTALQIQRHYFDQAQQHFAQLGDNSLDDVFYVWGELLTDMERVMPQVATVPDALQEIANRVDWAAKYCFLLNPVVQHAGTKWAHVAVWDRIISDLLCMNGGLLDDPSPAQRERFRPLLQQHGLSWDHYPTQRQLYFRLRELDVRYHDIDPDFSLFHLLKRRGRVLNLVHDDDIVHAQQRPPTTTRAKIRSDIIRHAHDRDATATLMMDWHRVYFSDRQDEFFVNNPFSTDASELFAYFDGVSGDAQPSTQPPEFDINIISEEMISPDHVTPAHPSPESEAGKDKQKPRRGILKWFRR